jgi:hypothetical protein
MLTTVRLMFTIPLARLHAPTSPPDEVRTEDAKAAVRAVVAALNEEVAPVLGALDEWPG